jgi:hypothetical protein
MYKTSHPGGIGTWDLLFVADVMTTMPRRQGVLAKITAP